MQMDPALLQRAMKAETEAALLRAALDDALKLDEMKLLLEHDLK